MCVAALMMNPNTLRPRIPLALLTLTMLTLFLGGMLLIRIPAFSDTERRVLTQWAVVLSAVIGLYGMRFAYRIFRSRHPRVTLNTPAPQGFARHIASAYGFSFCYPESWLLCLPHNPGLYREVQEATPPSGIHGPRNVNISWQDISAAAEREHLFEAMVNGVLNAMPGARLAHKQAFTTATLRGLAYSIRYVNAQGVRLCSYQYAVTNARGRILVILSGTSHEDDAEPSRYLFDRMAALITIAENGYTIGGDVCAL